jgi:hypothetical protein
MLVACAAWCIESTRRRRQTSRTSCPVTCATCVPLCCSLRQASTVAVGAPLRPPLLPCLTAASLEPVLLAPRSALLPQPQCRSCGLLDGGQSDFCRLLEGRRGEGKGKGKGKGKGERRHGKGVSVCVRVVAPCAVCEGRLSLLPAATAPAAATERAFKSGRAREAAWLGGGRACREAMFDACLFFLRSGPRCGCCRLRLVAQWRCSTGDAVQAWSLNVHWSCRKESLR